MKTNRNAARLFSSALAIVESASVRAWATSDHNKPIWIQIAANYIGKPDATIRLSIDIVSSYIGL